MIKDGIYSAENLKFEMFFKYIQEKWSKTTNFPEMMLFVRFLKLVACVFVGL